MTERLTLQDRLREKRHVASSNTAFFEGDEREGFNRKPSEVMFQDSTESPLAFLEDQLDVLSPDDTDIEQEMLTESELDSPDFEDESLSAIDIYLRQLYDVELLTLEQDVEYAKQIENGTEEEKIDARNKLIESNLRWAVTLAKKYIGRGIDFEDMIQMGSLGLLHATKKYDWRRGYRFSTYSTWWIKQAILRGIAENCRTIDIPVYANDAHWTIKKVTEQLEISLQRNPTIKEIADETGFTEEKVKIMQNIVYTVSADKPVNTDKDTLLSFISDESAEREIEEMIDHVDLEQNTEFLTSTLSDEEKEIITLNLGLGGGKPLSLREVARQTRYSEPKAISRASIALSKIRVTLRDNEQNGIDIPRLRELKTTSDDRRSSY